MQILPKKNYIDQFLIPPVSPFSQKGKIAFFPIFVFRKVLDCKHLKEMKGGWPVHPNSFQIFNPFSSDLQFSEKREVWGKKERRCLCLLLKFKVKSITITYLILNLLILGLEQQEAKFRNVCVAVIGKIRHLQLIKS